MFDRLTRRRLTVIADGPRDARADAYPMPRFPTGWYGVAASAELRPGAIANLHYVGRDLVAFRDAEGRPTVLDAFCPHYGAHLGVGGRLVDGTIECPFHGWRFGADGRCTHAPFATTTPKAAIRRYEVREHSGFVFAWFGEGEPSWELEPIPEVVDPRFATPVSRTYRARTHVQEMRENLVDESHFHHIHGQPSPSTIRFRPEGPRAFVSARLEKKVLGVFVDNSFESVMHGPGLMVVRTDGDYVNAVAIALTTPIDGTTSELRMTYYLRTPRFPRLTAPLLRRVFQVVSDPEVDSELAIWDRKRFVQRPFFLPHETGIRALRRWYAQFYDDAVASASSPLTDAAE